MSENTLSDPRIFFAAERTLLAWIRSGLTIMGFGFVVARFGLFLRLVAAEHTGAGAPSSSTHFSNYVGIALVLLGVSSMVIAAFQHRSFVSALPSADIPPSHSRFFPVFVAAALAVLGLVLAAYLAL